MPRRTLSSPTPRKRTVRTARPVELDVVDQISAADRSAEEKRQLILAHAAARTARDPVQVMSMWAGVLAVFVVIVGAWGYATIPGIVQRAGEPIPAQLTDAMRSVMDQFSTSASTTDPTTKINEATERIRALRTQIDEQQAVLNALGSASVTSTRADLFTTPTSTTSTTDTTSSTTSTMSSNSKR